MSEVSLEAGQLTGLCGYSACVSSCGQVRLVTWPGCCTGKKVVLEIAKFIEFSFLSDGLDFYYSSKQQAQKMVDFLQCTVPCRYVSHVHRLQR